MITGRSRGFPKLVEALRKRCERNPVPLDGIPGRRDKGSDPLLQAKQEGGEHKRCGYCKSEEHKSVDCDKIKGVAERRTYLSKNKCVLTVLLLGTVRQNADALLLASGVMGSTMVGFVISFQSS